METSKTKSLVQLRCIDALDIKMASGLFHKKDGYFGRKIRPLPPVRVLDEPAKEPPPKQQFTLTKDQLSGLFGHAKVHNLLPSGYSTRDYDYYKPSKD
ncbi:hypothetical protein OESDEN_16348 [Oesophagostomum dentatum]|uniref:Uncharacterized protein n=1 Tax=Oesophagostomum dentatum TaxID=61180 RepID=A0A0B1SF40_OESDE|nr:hypothetical protein OESDEN_16348 [Oesophagostomum dentatum]